VTDVQIDDGGVIHHRISEPDAAFLKAAASAVAVAGTLEAARRLDHMAHHTAQHMLSRALVDIAHAETVSARLGSSQCTIDADVTDISDRDLARAEDLVNAIARSDVAITATFPSAEELRRLPLRRPPKVEDNVRVIHVEGFDYSPCGGTHCTRSGQIGQIRISGTERYKGKLRIFFHAAQRALDHARAKDSALAELAASFTCGPLDVGAAVARLRADLKEREGLLGTTRSELIEFIAARAWSEHPASVAAGYTPIVLVRDRDDVGMLRALSGRLASRPDVVACCAALDAASGDRVVVVQRGAEAAFDCGRWLKTRAEACGGRGGGRPERAEGRLAASAPLDLTLP
jgi:alanyl-tRNA synthetase